MAALQGNFNLPAVSLTGGAVQTVIAIVAPANQRLKILNYKISFNGTNSANTPATVTQVLLTGGTFTNTAVAPVKTNEPNGVSETLQASSKNTCTVEPTISQTLDSFFEPVFGGFIGWQATPGQEVNVPGGLIWGLRINAPQSVSAAVSVTYEE